MWPHSALLTASTPCSCVKVRFWGKCAPCLPTSPCVPLSSWVMWVMEENHVTSDVLLGLNVRDWIMLSYKWLKRNIPRHWALLHSQNIRNATFVSWPLVSGFTMWYKEIILWKRMSQGSHFKSRDLRGSHGGSIHHFTLVLRTGLCLLLLLARCEG